MDAWMNGWMDRKIDEQYEYNFTLYKSARMLSFCAFLCLVRWMICTTNGTLPLWSTPSVQTELTIK